MWLLVQVQDKIKEGCSQKLRQVHEAFQTVLPAAWRQAVHARS